MPAPEVQIGEAPAAIVLPPARARRVIAVMRARLPQAAEKITTQTDRDEAASRTP